MKYNKLLITLLDTDFKIVLRMVKANSTNFKYMINGAVKPMHSSNNDADRQHFNPTYQSTFKPIASLKVFKSQLSFFF